MPNISEDILGSLVFCKQSSSSLRSVCDSLHCTVVIRQEILAQCICLHLTI
jgi:hypothetical protein